MTLHVELVVPDRRVWSGEAGLVIAKTLDGDIGVLTGHPPVIGVLAEGSLVRVLDPRASEEVPPVQGRGVPGVAVASGGPGGSAQRPGTPPSPEHAVGTSPGEGTERPGGSGPGEEIDFAVSDGFLSVSDDRVSILAGQAQLGSDVDTGAVRADLEALAPEAARADGEEPAEAKYARALLRAAGEQA